MRTPTDSAVVTLLNSGQPFARAELYTFTLDEGTVVRYCEWDVDIIYASNTYLHTGPIFQRSQSKFVVGLEVDELRIVVTPREGNTLLGNPWLAAVHVGVLDGAQVSLDFAFFDLSANPTQVTTPVGLLNWFTGRVSDIPMLMRDRCEILVRSDLERLDVRLPRNLYQAGCINTLFDPACRVNRTSFQLAGTVSNALSVNKFMISGPASTKPVDYFNQGTVLFTTGANAGVKRTVKQWSVPTVELFNSLRVLPTVGDQCVLVPGCDKTKDTCANKFNNVANFRGMPYIPLPDSVL